MNWAELAAIVSLITLVIVLIGGGVLWGSLTEKVAGQTKRLDGHKAELSAIDAKVNAHDVQIGKLEEWKSGFNAAARVSGRTPEVA
jgi:hypothetical protein